MGERDPVCLYVGEVDPPLQRTQTTAAGSGVEPKKKEEETVELKIGFLGGWWCYEVGLACSVTNQNDHTSSGIRRTFISLATDIIRELWA